MNFNFGYSQRKFGSQPNVRPYSTMGVPTKFDNLVSNNGHCNMFNTIMSNKSFSNPNFVNKKNPNILAPSIAGFVNLEKNYRNSTKDFGDYQNFYMQQPINRDKINTEHKPNPIDTQLIPEVLSSHTESSNNNSVACKMEPPKNNTDIKFEVKNSVSPKMNRRNKRRKRKNSKFNKQIASDKNIRCISPKQKKARNRKKCKPWHKTSLDQEIIECSESTLDSDSSNMIDETEQPFCITVTPKSSPIDIKPGMSNLENIKISPCHHEMIKSLSAIQLTKSEPMSPCLSSVLRLHLPSECESEDSFVVFDHCAIHNSEDFSTDEDSDFDEETDSDSDESDCDIEFIDKCDVQKKVTFKNDADLCKIYPMVKWCYAYHSARVGPWEQLARDRARFEARIRKTEENISKIFTPAHRKKIYSERFENTE